MESLSRLEDEAASLNKAKIRMQCDMVFGKGNYDPNNPVSGHTKTMGSSFYGKILVAKN